MNKEAAQRVRKVLDEHEYLYGEDLSARIDELLGVGGWRHAPRSAAL